MADLKNQLNQNLSLSLVQKFYIHDLIQLIYRYKPQK